MGNKLEGKKVAILATHGFEESELVSPKKALEKEGAEVEIVSPKRGSIRSWKDDDWNFEVDVDRPLKEASSEDYDALLIPGGVINPDKLREDEQALEFVRDFFRSGKPVGAICHGPQVLISADVVKGRTLTSFSSIRPDLENAGARWIDQRVVVDRGLITSRNPDDLDAFNRTLVENFAHSEDEFSAARF